MDEEKNQRIIEAILFAMGDAVPADRLAEALSTDVPTVRSCIRSLQQTYEKSGSGLMITEEDGCFLLCTRPQMYEYLIRIVRQPKKYALTDVLLETLSIVAYRQPVTRAEVERIRGVSCDHALNRLLEFGLIEEAGRMDAPGRPILFRTTETFLRCFGLKCLSELPNLPPAPEIGERRP